MVWPIKAGEGATLSTLDVGNLEMSSRAPDSCESDRETIMWEVFRSDMG